ncbi:putative peptidoglycan binding domain-containing protein [Beijerinckiaceae bacterium RH AL1]|nr:putative peptidoglycan binding domain-containing protein [Beijerinckiaceae bacterium RH CH11]VVB46072.1 putative peptidoglycan binding domain-containing protein [Beijerinckiaceae bacterium RH AL8]VVC55147.1 putative peptidoglycan binding domain-containing protein [Beijerinckiaceae bacterium RH AL1]
MQRASTCALVIAGAAAILAGAQAARADYQNPFGEQAEWAQGYDNDARFAVTRSTTPVLSQATFDATEHAIDQYRQIVQNGGWTKVPTGRTLKLGSSGPAVVALRKRLIVSGDLDGSSGSSPVFDSYVDAGVKHFQARHGFIENGVVGPDVLNAMNMPATMRLHQLEINLVRLKAFSGNLGGRYVMANIPAESVETVENGVVATHHRAGVGRIDRQSPVMQTRALDINFNPYWHVPESLIRKDLRPKMLADSNYLTEHHIHIIDKNGQEVPPSSIDWHTDQAFHYQYREDPGTENSLGVVRININNPYGVYMHDTSEKGVFGDDNRFVSSGCIRVQNVRDYVQWLLKDTPGWDRPHIDEAIRSGQQVTVKLQDPVPVYWVYITAWAYPNGIVEFRDDIYQRDGFSPAVTGSIGKPEPQDGVSKTSYDQGDPDGALEPGPDER